MAIGRTRSVSAVRNDAEVRNAKCPAFGIRIRSLTGGRDDVVLSLDDEERGADLVRRPWQGSRHLIRQYLLSAEIHAIAERAFVPRSDRRCARPHAGLTERQ
jgi:hypothetical protein